MCALVHCVNEFECLIPDPYDVTVYKTDVIFDLFSVHGWFSNSFVKGRWIRITNFQEHSRTWVSSNFQWLRQIMGKSYPLITSLLAITTLPVLVSYLELACFRLTYISYFFSYSSVQCWNIGTKMEHNPRRVVNLYCQCIEWSVSSKRLFAPVCFWSARLATRSSGCSLQHFYTRCDNDVCGQDCNR